MGEFFGLYQLAGRFAAVTGPLIWGITTDLLSDYEPWNFRIGILVLLINLVLGFLVLTRVRYTHVRITAGSPTPAVS
jgi:UMF1 family MFS transporter